MPRKQVNIRLDSLTIEAIKAIALKHNMSESQVITRAIVLLEEKLTTTPSVITMPPDLTDDQLEQVRQELRDFFGPFLTDEQKEELRKARYKRHNLT